MDKGVAHKIVAGDEINHKKLIEELYRAHRTSFCLWARKRYNLDDDTILDLFQDSVIVFYNHIVKNKLAELKSSPQAYLYGIGKNLMLKKIEKNRKVEHVESVDETLVKDVDLAIFRQMDSDDQKDKIRLAFQGLNEKCQEILKLFYFNQYSIEAIQHHLDYKSSNAVKSRKYQCLESLKKIYKSSNER